MNNVNIKVRHGQEQAHCSRSRLTPTELLLVILAVAIALALAVTAMPSAPSVANVGTRAYRVEAADTLWGLAQAFPVEGRSTVETVEILRALNDMDTSELRTGEVILIPETDCSIAVAQR